MVFFSTYRNSRLVSKEFFSGPITKMINWANFTLFRTWNATYQFAIPGDCRYYAFFIPFIYIYHLYHLNNNDHLEHWHAALIHRWGGSVEAVRKNLSPADQLRARQYADWEANQSVWLDKTYIFKPAGCPLPGKELYGDQSHAHSDNVGTHTAAMPAPQDVHTDREAATMTVVTAGGMPAPLTPPAPPRHH